MRVAAALAGTTSYVPRPRTERPHSETKFSGAAAWARIILSFIGIDCLWAGTFLSIATTGGVAGLVTWQAFGITLVYFKWQQIKAALSEAEPGPQYKHQRAMLGITGLNLACNIAAPAAACLVNWVFLHRSPFGLQDVANTLLCAPMLLHVLWVTKGKRQLVMEPRTLFKLALSSRIFPGMAMAFSPQIGLMNLFMVYGYLLISVQLAYNSWKLHLEAKRAGKAVAPTRWVMLADVGNLTVAFLLFMSWLLH